VGRLEGLLHLFDDLIDIEALRALDRPAGAAAEAWPADTDEAQTGRHMVEHLANALTDEVQPTAAAGARLLLDIDAPVLALQLCGQAQVLSLRARCGLLSIRRKPGLDPCQIDLEVLKSELPLFVVEPLGAPSKLLRWSFCTTSRSRSISPCAAARAVRSTASERTMRCNVSTSSGRAAKSMSMRECKLTPRAVSPNNEICESMSRSNHPAIAGRHRCSGARQSTPSIRSANCAEVSRLPRR
jgi:hypothetical protein